MTSEVAKVLPETSKLTGFQDLVDDAYQPRPAMVMNGIVHSRNLSRMSDLSNDNDLPEVNRNWFHRSSDDLFNWKKTLVSQHLQSLADDNLLFVRPANGTKQIQAKANDDEEWIVNLLSLQEFIRISELERIVERKYGSDALRILRIVVEKHHIDQDQVPIADDLANNLVREIDSLEERSNPAINTTIAIRRNTGGRGNPQSRRPRTCKELQSFIIP
jgi:hypothetical protein